MTAIPPGSIVRIRNFAKIAGDGYIKLSRLDLSDLERAVAADLKSREVALDVTRTALALAEAVAEAALVLMCAGWFTVEDVMGDKDVDALYAALRAWDGARRARTPTDSEDHHDR